jgi:uncharacterized protein
MNSIGSSIFPLGPASAEWHAAPGPHLRGILAALVLSIAALFLSGQARAQTFACVNAETPTELAICNSEELIVLDERLSAMIARELGTARNMVTRRSVTAEHKNWLRLRDECSSDQACLITRYALRLTDLAGPVPVRNLASLAEYRPQN